MKRALTQICFATHEVVKKMRNECESVPQGHNTNLS